MNLLHPIDGYKHFQANDRLTASEVVMLIQPRAGYVMWELGEQGPQLPLRGGDPRVDLKTL